MTPSIWTGMYGQLPLHDALQSLHKCNWQTFEISTEHLVEIERHNDPDSLITKAQSRLQELDISTPQAHALLQADVAAPLEQDRERDIDRLITHMKIASRLGVEIVVIHPGGGRSGLSREDGDPIRTLNIQAFRRLADVAGEHDMRIGIENMPFPGVASSTELLDLLHQIDHSAIGITLDTSHANMCSLDISEMVLDFGSNLIATHISDNNGASDQHLTPGGGNIDWPEVMQAFSKIGYQGTLNLEIPGERHRVPALHQLKTIFAFEIAEWLTGLADPAKNAPNNRPQNAMT